MQRTVRQFDVETGEVLDAGTLVYVQHRARIKEGWVMTFQDGLVRLAQDRGMTGEQWRVLAYLMGRLDFENFIYVPQAEVAQALGMQPSHVSRAIAALCARQVLVRGPSVGRVGTMRLSHGLGWKGRVRNLQAEQRRRLQVVKR